MEDLLFLVNKGLITIDNRPIKPEHPIKVVNNGVIFQQQCHNGLPYDIAVSWLQKAIRRNLIDQALFCAYHMASLGKIFRSHLLNRLIVIMSEDIGPSEPGLPSLIGPLFFEAKKQGKDGTVCSDILHQIIHILSKCKKSRITDLLVHTSKPIIGTAGDLENYCSDIEGMVQWSLYYCRHKTKKNVTVRYGDCVYHKKLWVYEIWNVLLQSEYHKSDIIELFKLFSIRGPVYGVLHLIHAITLCFLDDQKVDLPDLPSSINWKDLSKLDFPLMNDAVDQHTFYGRKHLGRDIADFLHNGSRLENWKPMINENALLEKCIAEIEPPQIETSEPRPYQKEIVDKTVAHFATHDAGWLLMACGTGKTKTSFWVMNELLAKNHSKGVYIVVTPLLQLMRQFFQCWSAMNRMNGTKVITGIVASSSDTFRKDRYINYDYLRTDQDINQFLGYSDDIKFIFTTYHSLDKLSRIEFPEQPKLTVYDEAHHASTHRPDWGGKELFLTATPNRFYYEFGDIICNYNLRSAINDGYLTPYDIHVFGDEGYNPDIVDCLSHIQLSNKKTIVYCRTNAIANDLYNIWLHRGGSEDSSFYISCRTGKRERDRIFRSYRNLDRAVIFNCAILGEGVDFSDCDSIFIHSGYSSQTRVVQAIGRPIRLSEGKSKANIYMINDVKTTTRINAIAAYDPEVYDLVKYIY